MLRTYQRRSRLKLATTIITILVVAGVVVVADHIKSKSSTATVLTQTSSPTTPASTSSTSSGTPTSTTNTNVATTTSPTSYKDGTYTATGDYYVPHGEETIKISLTIQNDTITSSSVQNSENDFTSAQYQENFASAYKSYVVGKKIGSLQVSVIAGASDTTQGFNDAVSQIESQAKA